MYCEEAPIYMVVQASCSLLTYLSRSLYGLTTTRQQSQNNHLVQQRSRVLNSQASEHEQRSVHQIGESDYSTCKCILFCGGALRGESLV